MPVEEKVINALLAEIKRLRKEKAELELENIKLKVELKQRKTSNEAADNRAEWGIYG